MGVKSYCKTYSKCLNHPGFQYMAQTAFEHLSEHTQPVVNE